MRIKFSLPWFGFLCFVSLNASTHNLYLVAAAQAQARISPVNVTADGGSVKTISLSMTPQATINPLIYGVNYVWATTPESQFSSWLYQMQGTKSRSLAPASLVRYPGGWDGEWYDWGTNQMEMGGPASTEPGVAPAELLSSLQPLILDPPDSQGWITAMNAGGTIRSASFQLPIRGVVEAKAPADLPALIAQLASNYVEIIGRFQNNVRYWEIGNEWWLQNGAAKNTAPLSSNAVLSSNLTRYAALVAAAAPMTKSSYPNIKLYVSADWRSAGAPSADDQFVQLRKQIGEPAWALIDGISIHPYCGTNVQKSLCTSIPEQVKKIKQETGKNDIYASEWAVVMNQSTDDFGIRNANATVSALQDLALAGISEAAYWPSIGSVPAIALTNSNNLNATGAVFRTMSLLYEGQALPTYISNDSGPPGQTAAVAARNSLMGNNGVAVIIPTNGDGPETINLSLAGTGLTKVSSSSVIYSDSPDIKSKAVKSYTVPLHGSIIQGSDGNSTAQFVLNPGTPGRGSNWEIAVLELQ